MPLELSLPDYDDAELDGLACVRCGRVGGPMDPIADGPRGPLYQHVFDRDCPERGRDD
jgi:hypothetical protein